MPAGARRGGGGGPSGGRASLRSWGGAGGMCAPLYPIGAVQITRRVTAGGAPREARGGAKPSGLITSQRKGRAALEEEEILEPSPEHLPARVAVVLDVTAQGRDREHRVPNRRPCP